MAPIELSLELSLLSSFLNLSSILLSSLKLRFLRSFEERNTHNTHGLTNNILTPWAPFGAKKTLLNMNIILFHSDR